MSNELQQAEILLGDDAEKFFQSDIGKYIIGRAGQEVDEATEGLKKVDPEDTQKIRELQFKVQVAESVPCWLQELIIAGKQAMEILQEEQ